MRHIRTSIVMVALIILIVPHPADAVDLGKYMPWLFDDNTQDKPEDTLEAPFRDEMDSQQDKKTNTGKNQGLTDLYKTNKEERGSGTHDHIDRRHRSDRQIALWVTDQVANALSFKAGNIKKEFETLRPSFTQGAYQNYRQSLRQHTILKNVRNKNIRVNALVEDDPFLVKDGAKQGRYKWHFDVPVMISFINHNDGQAQNERALSQKFDVSVKVTRKKGREKTQGVIIERWQMDIADN